MTLNANRVTRLRRTVLPQGSQGPDGACPLVPPHRPELRAATACSDFQGSTRPRWPAGDRACAPASVAAARRRFLTPSRGTVRGAASRGGRSHPPARAPCRPRAGALRGGVMAPPVGVAPRQRAATAAAAAAAPLSPPHAPPATATWLHVPPCVLAAMEPAGLPGIYASPSAPPPWRPGYCTYVPGIKIYYFIINMELQVGPPGQGPGSEASTFCENTDTQFGKKPVVTSAHPPVLDIRSDWLGDSLTGQISMSWVKRCVQLQNNVCSNNKDPILRRQMCFPSHERVLHPFYKYCWDDWQSN